MIDLPELVILDVGHGNCAILRDTKAVTVIDCPPTSTLIETLDRMGIDTIDHILISHADVDHVGGLPNLLNNVNIRNVYLNPDAEKRGKNKGGIWKGVRIALASAAELGTEIHPSLTSVLSKKIISGQVEIEILAPSPDVALGGSGGNDPEGRMLHSNSMSVVVGLIHNSHRVALLPGDMDDVGLDNLLKKQKDIESQILIFPHHGGSPGSSNGQQFAQKLCGLVKPNLVLFSLHRERFGNPREDVMRGVISATSNAHVMCTQLSRKCSKECPDSDFSHLTNLPAIGQDDDACCGGTISINMDGTQTTYEPQFSKHRAFVSAKVPKAMCLQHLLNAQPQSNLLHKIDDTQEKYQSTS